jgi:hypothetical protein
MRDPVPKVITRQGVAIDLDQLGYPWSSAVSAVVGFQRASILRGTRRELKPSERACRVLTPAEEEGRPPMSSLAIASVVFGCSFGAAPIGMVLQIKLPDDHLDSDSRDVVKLVMGLIATMSALVLSLLIASANSSYDRQRGVN